MLVLLVVVWLGCVLLLLAAIAARAGALYATTTNYNQHKPTTTILRGKN